MGLKQRLIALFAVLSLVAVLDVATSGLDAFRWTFEVRLVREDRVPVPVPSREPDYEMQRSLEQSLAPLAGVGWDVDGTSGRPR